MDSVDVVRAVGRDNRSVNGEFAEIDSSVEDGRLETFADWALWYVRNGFALIPLHPFDPSVPQEYGECEKGTPERDAYDRPKRAAIEGWSENPFTTEEQVIAYWERNPTANIGIATGAHSHDSIVFDLDCHNVDADGIAAFEQWQEKHGEVPRTLRCDTPTGGMHLWYRAEGQTCTNKPLLGIDLRASGGYVVAPPSIHPNGEIYEWDGDPDPNAIAGADDAVLACAEWVRSWSKDGVNASEYCGGKAGKSTLGDDELKEKARNARNGKKFERLWDGSTDGYTHDDGTPDCSAADFAFLLMLAFWSNRDPEQMERLFRASERPKVNRRKDKPREFDKYLARSIASAIRKTEDTYVAGCSHGREGGCENGASDEADITIALGDSSSGIRFPLRKSQITDMGLAALFAKSTADVKYVAELKRYTTFDGTKWNVSMGDQLAERRVKDFIVTLKRIVGKGIAALADVDTSLSTPEAEEARELSAIYSRLCDYDQQYRRASLVRDIRSERGILCGVDRFDREPHLLNVLNGTLDLGGNEVRFRAHDPNDFITRVAPVTYDPKAECPLFIRVVNEVLEGDVELIRFLQKWFGIIVAGITENDKFLLLGLTNRAGKNTVMQPLFTLLGGDEKDDRSAYAVSVEPATLSESTVGNGHGPSSDVARMRGKRLLLTSEFKKAVKIDCDLLKRLTGGYAPISARRMRENEVSFIVDGTVVMLANVFPIVEDETLFDGDRPMCIPFNHRYEEWERDKTLRARLREPRELSGVLNWALEGLAAYQDEGLEPIPDEVREMCAKFRSESDSLTTVVGDFVHDHLVYAEGEMVTTEEVYSLYAKGVTGTPMRREDFKSRVGLFTRVLSRKRDPRNGSYRRNVISDHKLV